MDENTYRKAITTCLNTNHPIMAWLTTLYYEIGKQWTNFDLQQSWTRHNGDVIWSRRHKITNILHDNNKAWAKYATNRTQLNNECVLDFDPHPTETPAQFKQRVENTIKKIVIPQNAFMSAWRTGGRGIHVHIYDDKLAKLTPTERKKQREVWQVLTRAERKGSDNANIMLEFSKHRKTGNTKTPL